MLATGLFWKLHGMCKSLNEFQATLITSNAEEIIQAWEEGEKAKPMAKAY